MMNLVYNKMIIEEEPINLLEPQLIQSILFSL